MFEWLFASALDVPQDTPSLAWDMVVDDAPPAPANTLEYELDPVQELFCDIAYQRENAWAKYMTELNSHLASHL